MMTNKEFIAELRDTLDNNILNYWIEKMTDPRGGYYGRRDGHDILHPEAEKGAILNGRILWSFSTAYRLTGNEAYAKAALRARDYIAEHFVDPEYGGVYWSVTAEGEPLDTKKQYYAIAFVIYGLAEHFRATGDTASLDLAKKLWRDIEDHSRDHAKGGYLEASTRDWQPIADMRLSDKDANSSKTMNTHLHIMEGFTSLLRVWRDPQLLEATKRCLRIFLDIIEDPKTHHLGLFFDDDWNRQDGIVSYGHDIEASWLMVETAEVIGDPELLEETLRHTRHIAYAALEGRTADGAMVYERHADGSYDNDRHWWVQAETVLGQIYLALYHGETWQMERAKETWEYIKKEIVDYRDGEWYWSRRETPVAESDGSLPAANVQELNLSDDHAGFWKCPYHNSRMCVEAIERILDLEAKD